MDEHFCTQLIDEKKLSQLLSVSVPTLRRWRLLKRGPSFRRLCGSVRYSLADVEKYLESCTCNQNFDVQRRTSRLSRK